MKRFILQALRARTAVVALASAAGLLLGAGAPALQAAPAPAAEAPNTLQSIAVQPLGDSQLQLTLHLSAPAPTPLAFAIDKPARISVDLPNTTLALPSRRIDVGTDGIATILAAEANGRSRLVLDLDQPMPYQTRIDGNDIVMVVGKSATRVASTGPAAAAARAAGTAAAAPAAARSIESIDFRRSATGGAQLVVRLTDPHTPIDLKQQGSQVVIDFAGASLPRRLTRRYDTLDFGTPVSGFEAESVNGSARIVLDATGNFDQLAYQTDDQYVVEVNPLRQAAAAAGTAQIKKSYQGQRLTLNFQDISTRAVLQLLADASGQNIVVSDSVKGSVTLRLQNVPWDQALDIVLQTKGLGKRQDGNVIIVAPADELATREKADLASQ
jgi:type IV pilus assembly protein PilQ